MNRRARVKWSNTPHALSNDVAKPNRRTAMRAVKVVYAETKLVLLDEMTNENLVVPPPDVLCAIGLMRREAEVLGWVIEGKTNAETAALCQLSSRTVQKHLEHLFQKLGVETRTAAAVRALEIFRRMRS